MYDKDIILKMAEKSGLHYEDIIYDIDMTEIMAAVFNFVMENDIPAILFGCTAINRGFLKEKQRLSKDLDIMVREDHSSSATMENVALQIRGLLSKKYALSKSEEGDEREEKLYSIKLFAKTENGSSIRISFYREDLAFGYGYFEMHSLLEYAGYPYVNPVKAKCYVLEGLMARKIYAMADRRLYKDLYDSRYGLEIIKDYNAFNKALYGITGNSSDDTIRRILDMGAESITDEEDYETLVQPKYRESKASMLKYVKMKLGAIQDKKRA
jgi:predicted nucleotidyltransferase component of viral defense system